MVKIEYIGTAFFFLALLHTFSVSFFAKLSHRFPAGSAGEAFFHLLSEVEVVFRAVREKRFFIFYLKWKWYLDFGLFCFC
jgi:hypothetical protein